MVNDLPYEAHTLMISLVWTFLLSIDKGLT